MKRKRNAGLFEIILRRLLQSTTAKNEAELATILGIQPQSVDSARKRKRIPSGWIVQIAEDFEISADWLLFGEGGESRKERPIPFHKDTFIWVAGSLERALDEYNLEISPTLKAFLIAEYYKYVINDKDCKRSEVCLHSGYNRVGLSRFAGAMGIQSAALYRTILAERRVL